MAACQTSCWCVHILIRPCGSQTAADLCHLAAAAALRLDGPCVPPLQDTLSAMLPAFLGVRPDVLQDVKLGALIGRGEQGGWATTCGVVRLFGKWTEMCGRCGNMWAAACGRPAVPAFHHRLSPAIACPTPTCHLQVQWVVRTEASGRYAFSCCASSAAMRHRQCARWMVHSILKLCKQGQPSAQ